MVPDFSGYATKAGLKCSDGRTITPQAFQDMDGVTVPLVWQHSHGDVSNVLGHAVLESRDDGVYAYGFFNETASAQTAKALVQHQDITALSIYANQLVEKGKSVLHGLIREVSLVLSGANPGAFIDNVNIAHSDGMSELLEDEAVIYTGLPLELEHADGGMTVKDVYDTLNEEQKSVVEFMIGAALESAGAAHSSTDGDEPNNTIEHADGDDDDTTPEGDLIHKEGNTPMTRNVFQSADETSTPVRKTLTHSQLQTIVEDAQRLGSLKESFLAHAVEYGIENIDFLFPDAKTLTSSPDFVSRRMEWVSTVLGGTKHSPFSRIKTITADITHDEARAKGYVKGNLKKEEFFALLKRVTTPTTIYKKQKLDRDDIVDITDLDVVAWLKAEMRVMLDEEIARATLVGDGRDVADEDKISEVNIRPIAKDDEFYTHRIVVPNNINAEGFVEAVLRAREAYHGSGNPTMFCTEAQLVELLLSKDKVGRRIYASQAELEAMLRVSRIVPVPIMEGETVDHESTVMNLKAVLVNLTDYTHGADKGGSIAMFDDFDIDYNQYKYLIETRLSGCLTKWKSAQIVLGDPGETAVNSDTLKVEITSGTLDGGSV